MPALSGQVLMLSRFRTFCCHLLASTVFITVAAPGSWIPNDSAAAAAEYQNRGPSATAYELTLGDLLPEHLLAQDQSLNFVNKHFRSASHPSGEYGSQPFWALAEQAPAPVGLWDLPCGLYPRSLYKACTKLQRRCAAPHALSATFNLV